MLLSCAAEIRDKSDPDGRLKALPDWTTIALDDERIRGHPFFHKTVGYQDPQSPAAVVPQPLPHQSPEHPAFPTRPPPLQSPTPAIITRKHYLVVPGNSKVAKKRKAPTPETEVEILESPVPKKMKMSKTRREAGRAPLPHEMERLRQDMTRAMSRAPPKQVTLKELVTDDEVDVPADKVINIKVSSSVLHVFVLTSV
jgi:hypothetical protein